MPAQVHKASAHADSASWLRVFVVSTLAFAPAFTFAILIELLPLQQPSLGWRANWVFWIRLLLSSAVLSFGVAIQTTVLVPAAQLKISHALFIAIGTSIGFVLQLLVIARFWRFPVPFLILLGNPAWQIARYSCLLLAIGIKKWRGVPAIKKQIGVARKVASMQSVLVLIYPAFNAVFLRLHGLTQVAFVLLLPVIKFSMTRLLTRTTAGIPAATAFGLVTVELFDSLYLFKCMQTAGSMLSGAGLITVDLFQNIYHLWTLHKHVQRVKQHLARNGSTSEYKTMVQQSMGRSVSRSRSVLKLDLPNPSSKVAVVPVGTPQRQQPLPDQVRDVSWTQSSDKTGLDKSVYALLLECEHIVLTEFIECAVPMFYALYVVILFHLPNAEFYPEMRRLDAETLASTVRNIVVYASLELVSLFYMHFLLRRQLDISALHLLANLLEREVAILQSVFMTWVIIVLQFTLEHGGTWLLLGCFEALTRDCG